MHTDMEARACDLAEYLLANNTTVRAAAKQSGVSKSTVHKDLTERLSGHHRVKLKNTRVIKVFLLLRDKNQHSYFSTVAVCM